ncbi:bifunctional precorrin-2 dehydrogenase/sirohydrochlorin ferrochelatase [Methanonatronarchaeum sp. AMET-Sl]|uniref:precorrin-2 dehydrogenase/sirohydrochlorin ferrochelatase family protein n=1 Tax=Methanonatronarchaeum sp. AMET-Sl TaxID=3037654 RepID=UPI00244E1A71|nr:bifunctional precorrin-2 dehydrogenase/sirohydrochlorin ferrochelatase [Methanonatronarchaeum sp. AMET-Sl]WGI16832.1 bifunctional precorrin-2 dehydrogenase/sirohydrochlorin ferrochelatase [Methanonatronarchaeum sp. AMET-Sl]
MKPIILSLKNKKIVIFGGGSVGLRKSKYFKEADLIVVSERFHPEFRELDITTEKTKITKPKIDKYIKNAFLVIPATDNEKLNEIITKKARRKNILVNQVDGELGDVIIPSTIQDEYLLAISSYGRSPAFCKYLRKKLENELGPEYGLMVKLQEEMREILKQEIENQGLRREILWEILESEEIWDLLRKNFYQKAVKKSREIIGERNG